MADTKESSEPTKKVEEEVKTPFFSFKKLKPDLREKELPLVDVEVTNPVTYIKSWWKKIIGNEGVEITLRVRPLTTIAVILVVLSISYGVGVVLPIDVPFLKYVSKTEITESSPTQGEEGENVRQTAFTGVLKYSYNKYYLLTSSSEAITLEVPEEVELKDLIGKRILAIGNYYHDSNTMKVENIENLEILPDEKVVVPVTSPSPSPAVLPTPTPASSSAGTI